MKTTMIIFCSLILFSSALFPQQETSKMRVGVFDSRCIAIAYARSDDFRKEITDMRSRLAKAKESDDKELIKELEQVGPTRQVILHQQGFSTGSVINIIEKIKDQLPEVAKVNDVKMLLSKWEVMFLDDSVDLIDVTDQLTALFNPNDDTKKTIEQIKSMEPVPLEKVGINPRD